MANEAKWYVVHTYSGYENKVESTLKKTVENRQLQDVIQDVRIPTEKVTEIGEKGKVKESERKLYPGYVFIKMVYTDETWYIVRNIRGCTGFVGSSTTPVPLTEEEVEKMGVEVRTVEVLYNKGDKVKIVSGPLADFTGTVQDIDVENNTVKVVVYMLGRETPAELELNQVQLAD